MTAHRVAVAFLVCVGVLFAVMILGMLRECIRWPGQPAEPNDRRIPLAGFVAMLVFIGLLGWAVHTVRG